MSKRRKVDGDPGPMGTLDKFLRKRTSDREPENQQTAGPADVQQPGPSAGQGGIHTGEDAPVDSLTPSASSTSARKKRTKDKQADNFNADWKKHRPWLYHEPGVGMFCVLCRRFNKTPFGRTKWNTAPCVRMRESSIKEHEECESHKDAERRDKEGTLMQDIRKASNPAVSHSAMEKAFASLYFLVQRRIAHVSIFEPLLDLLSFLGLKVKEQIRVAKNATYTSDKTVQEMLYVISEVLENDTVKELTASNHYSIMLDESSDCTNVEQLALHARYLDADGELQVKFLKIVDVLQPEIDAIARAARSGDADPNEAGIISLNAEVITKRVKEYIEGAGIDMQRMRGVGTDGASVMTGKRNGVVKRLKDDVPCLIGIHCTAHRLNLASSQAAKCVKDVDQFENILRQLFDFFDNSNVRTAGFLAVQNILLPEKEGAGKADTPGKLLEPSTTRWLSIGNSVERVKEAFADLIVTLQREGTERADARALGLNRLVTTYKFTATMLLLCDVLPHINALSRAFQKQDSDYTVVYQLVTSTITTLKSLKVADGVNLARLPEFLEIAKPGSQNLPGEVNFKENIRGKYIDALTENLQDRFQSEDVQGMSLLLSLFNTSDIQSLPAGDVPYFGKTQVTAAHGFFEASGVLGPLNELQQEWLSLKNYIRQVPDMSDTALIQGLCMRQALQAVYPNFSQLAKVLRVIPTNTADPERTFSQMKLVKTKVRNRMVEQTLDAILRVVIEGPPLDAFPARRAVRLWARKKNRRLTHC